MTEDPEIHSLLQRLQEGPEEVQRKAWDALQKYRAEALEAARLPEPERRIALARQNLKDRLVALLSYAGERVRFLKDHADSVIEVRDRHKRAWREMVDQELRHLLFDGFSPRVAEQAGKNNLGVRKAELDAELEQELERLQEVLRRRLEQLAEDADDFA